MNPKTRCSWGAMAALLAAGAAFVPTAHAQNYVLTDLGPAASPTTGLAAGTGVNGAGQVSGYTGDSTALTFAAFRYDSPSLTVGLPPPSGFDSFYATALSDSATVAGVARVTSTGAFRAAYYDLMSTTALPLPTGDSFSAATGVNTSGTVVGHSYDTAGRFHAFLYSGSSSARLATGAVTNSDAYAVNNAGQIAAAADDATRHFHAVQAGGPSPVVLAGLSGSLDTYAYGLNAAGDLVGESASDGASRAVLWPHGATTPTDLGLLSGMSYGAARAVNSAGVAVGDSGDVNYVTFRATLWDGSGAHDLNAVLPAPVASAWTLTRATGINDAGQISGIGLVSGQQHGYLLTPIPTDVTAQVSVVRGGYRYVSRTGHFLQPVTITNTGGTMLPDPLSFVLDSLTRATLVGSAGLTRYDAPTGSPYVNTPPGGLALGASVSLVLEFSSQPGGYTPRLLAGTGVR